MKKRLLAIVLLLAMTISNLGITGVAFAKEPTEDILEVTQEKIDRESKDNSSTVNENREILDDYTEEVKLKEVELKIAEEKLAKANEMIEDGAFSLLNWVKENYKEYASDAESGLRILDEWREKKAVNPKLIGDASTYKNIPTTVTLLEKNNELRLSDNNFDRQKVSTNFEMLAMAIVSANRSTDPSNGHLGTFIVAENLAWGYRNPYDGWYIGEKKIFDNYISQYMNENPSKTKEEAIDAAINALGYEIGHYLNIMSENYKIVAIAENYVEGQSYRITHAWNANMVYPNTIEISQEKYREIIESFMEATDTAVLEKTIQEIKNELAEISNVWKEIDGTWYYFKEDGSMAKSEFLWLPVEGKVNVFNYKFFNSKGENIDQFYEENGSIWLSQSGPTSTYVKGWWTDSESGLTYFFRKTSGTRVKGWQYIDGFWRYFRTSGSMITSRWEWLKVEGTNKYNWKFFNYKGESIDQFRSEGKDTWLSQAGPDTEYARGWKTLSGYTYFFRETSGTRVSGFQFIDGSWRYFRESGTLATGRQFIDGKWYVFDKDGSLVK